MKAMAEEAGRAGVGRRDPGPPYPARTAARGFRFIPLVCASLSCRFSAATLASSAPNMAGSRQSLGGAGIALPKPVPFGTGSEGGLSGGRSGVFPVLDMGGFRTPFSAGPRMRGFLFVDSSYSRYACVQPDGDLTPRMTFLAQLHNPVAGENEPGPADRSPAARSFFAGAVQPGARAFADSDAFLFGDGGEDRDDGLTKDAG